MPSYAIKSNGIRGIAQDRIIGRTASGVGVAEELTASTAQTLLGISASDAPTFAAITQLSSSDSDPDTDDFSAGTWGLHKNTTSSKTYLAVNDSGSIVKQELGASGSSFDQDLNTSDNVEFVDVTSTGQAFLPAATSTNPSICFTGSANKRTGLFEAVADTAIGISVAAGERHSFHSNMIRTRAGNSYSWVSGIDPSGGTVDVSLFRGGAGILEQRDGTNSQKLHIYDSFTDVDNYSRGRCGFDSSVFKIGPEAAGTGANRAMEISTTSAGLTIKTIASGTLSIYAGYTNRGRIDYFAGSSGTQLQLMGNGCSSVTLGDGTFDVSGNNLTSSGDVTFSGATINLANLPTSDTGLATGDLWVDTGGMSGAILKVKT